MNSLFINIHNILGEGGKLRNHKLTLESLRYEHCALLDDPVIKTVYSLCGCKDRYLVNWWKSSLMLSIPYSDEQVFCLMVLSVLISGANLGSFLKIPICSNSYNQSMILCLCPILLTLRRVPELAFKSSSFILHWLKSSSSSIFNSGLIFLDWNIEIWWKNLLFHQGAWSASSLVRGHALVTIIQMLSFKIIFVEYSYPLSVFLVFLGDCLWDELRLVLMIKSCAAFFMCCKLVIFPWNKKI